MVKKNSQILQSKSPYVFDNVYKCLKFPSLTDLLYISFMCRLLQNLVLKKKKKFTNFLLKSVKNLYFNFIPCFFPACIS